MLSCPSRLRATPPTGRPWASRHGHTGARCMPRGSSGNQERTLLLATVRFVTPDIVHHAGIFVDEIGRDPLKKDLAALLTAFPDVRFTTADVVAGEDGAAVRWIGRGTHTGPLHTIKPTDKKVVFTRINVQ